MASRGVAAWYDTSEPEDSPPKKMMKPHILTYLSLLLILPLVLGYNLQEDDLVFDDIGEESSSTPSIERHIADRSRNVVEQDRRLTKDTKRHHRVERLWDIPDVVVPVGHIFKLRITRQAFGGSVERYEIHEANGQSLSRWLYWDDAASTLLGVPSKKDAGNHHLIVKAIGKHGDNAKDAFVVQVVPEKREEVKHKDGKSHCKEGEDQTLLTIFLDVKFENLTPSVKVNAIENLAGFLGLHASAFSMHPQSAKETLNPDSLVIFTGPGNVKYRTERHLTAIQWQVGCDGHLWRHQTNLVKQLRDQAKDGTLAEVLQLPVLSWRVKTDSSFLSRSRREAGSGDFDADDYEGYDYDDDEYGEDEDGGDDNEAITEPPLQPSFVPNVNSRENTEWLEHPHRHHHGEETLDLGQQNEEVDEREIVPSIDPRNAESNAANASFNGSILTTTTTQFTPSSSSSSSSSSTTTTTTMPTTTTSTTTTQATTMPTSTTPTTTTTTTTTTTPTTTTITTTTTTTTSTTTSSITTTSTIADTTPATTSTTVVPSTEPTKVDIMVEEREDNTQRVDMESVTLLPTISPEITTTLPSITTLQFSTTAASTSATGRAETEPTTVFANVTYEEATYGMTVPVTRQPTTSTPIASSTIVGSTSAPTTIPPTQTPTLSTFNTKSEIHTATSTVGVTIISSTTVPSTTAAQSTTIVTIPPSQATTENIEIPISNLPPKKDRRLKKLRVIAGKPLSYVIPADTFSDPEDGDTRNLKLVLYLQGVPIKTTNWLQFNPRTQEVYGLPLENDISTWNYELVATDSGGLNVSDILDVHVQQHRLSRIVNHEFSIYLKIDKRNLFPTDIDWELQVIGSLAELYGDADPYYITVRAIDIDHDQAIFTWMNDTFPRSSECPKDHINELLRILIDKDGDPSPLLRGALAPELRVKRVVFQGIGQCEDMNRQSVIPKAHTEEPKVNFPPVPRNQVDHVNATVGELLVFKVPEDTFFDSEDGSSRNMKMSLLTIERTPIPPDEWLQFDNKNQEFYGVPLQNDVGRKEYQLVVTDREGASATDGLVVVVHPAPPMTHTVEFSMTLDIPYESFAHSAMQKRNFVEKLRDLYHDRDTSAISLRSISNGSTVITWHNRTLPTAYCAHEEVNRLRAVLVKSDNDRRSVTDEVLDVMGLKFPVKQITVIPMGICRGELTGVHSPDSHVPPVDDSTSIGAFHDDYLITFVLPAIIIAAMLILAGVIACILYKRRRSGKMSVSEQDDERQSFRSKGIPVIFQDELDEKPDPGNKSPVILKEEKPPLPPPEYQKTEDGADVPMLPKENSEEPYQPPPPFATNRDTNRQNRPKPTPTYRKPPPYVPP
ncbi:dystroglycan 1-like isoform X4 [Vespa velutina]|uniref:dystroglycan 1-like isoform X4 n=1 Tax=Vespa velutina TaxID=202808 RepID=UPI001FB1FAC9|nr:dystroglycan 1-like isoform X4 [Vespa velutina]